MVIDTSAIVAIALDEPEAPDFEGRIADDPVRLISAATAFPVQSGYADGMVLLVRVDDGAEILAKRPGDAPITALAWSADGTLLAFGTENGEAGILDLA